LYQKEKYDILRGVTNLMSWLTEYKTHTDTAIDAFFRDHYTGNITPNEQIFHEAISYAVKFGNPSRIRPILAMVVYEELLGLTAESALVNFIGLEFIHIGLLLHGDVIGIRRSFAYENMPPVMEKYGKPMTILVGDALVALGIEALTRLGKMSIIDEIIHAITDK
jgi:geranylgeranyl pyrophosphate synthase